MAFVARTRYSWRCWFGCSSPFHVLPLSLSLLRIRTAAWEARGPAADWSFIRLTGFRSSIRAMELWGVQSCIGACFAHCFPRSLACARGHALVGQHGMQQQTATSKPNPKSPVKPVAKRTTTEPAREGRGQEKKIIANYSGSSAQNQSMTSRHRALRQFIPRENLAESIEITARQQEGQARPLARAPCFMGRRREFQA